MACACLICKVRRDFKALDVLGMTCSEIILLQYLVTSVCTSDSDTAGVASMRFMKPQKSQRVSFVS